MDTYYVQIQSTTNTKEEAEYFATHFVQEGLSASVQIIPNMTSIYIWEGKICNTEEYLLVMNTTIEHVERICAFLQAHHTYVLPECIVTPIIDGSPLYIQWIQEQTHHTE